MCTLIDYQLSQDVKRSLLRSNATYSVPVLSISKREHLIASLRLDDIR
jgi:hypothetical protein